MASNDETDALIRSLKDLSLKDKKLVKSTIHAAPADPDVLIRSWKMDEWKYSVHPSPFPTLARGLFTRWVPEADSKASEDETTLGKHVIVARGYDKFFNIGEVPWNTWEALEKYTKGSYYLTLKSNGCIIFIAALTAEKVVVTSKHSLGAAVAPGQLSHAMAGEQWLHKHLASKGKTEADLASRLLEDQVTAVAELCDDSFEEHVLGYPPELTGLHLHGLNKNQGAFKTASPSSVDDFADEFGFIKTATLTKSTLPECRKFAEEAGETGTWRGEAVEGFVVRCKIAEAATNAQIGSSASSGVNIPPPYPPNSDFFFKVKFEEPYLMYRAWREITQAIISYKTRTEQQRTDKPLSIPRSRLTRPESKLYREWVEREIDIRPSEFEDFGKGHGIIETRNRFLEWMETEEGQRRLAQHGGKSFVIDLSNGTTEPVASTSRIAKKTVIVPVAVPGCGKTSVSVALARLFSFGHTQSDDVKAKKTASTFQRNIVGLLESYDVVIADRNNHLAQHRQGIREAVSKFKDGPVRLIALNWALEKHPFVTTHRLCSERVLARGENHQSLRPAGASHEDVIWTFMTQTEALDSEEVDDVVEMNVLSASFEESVNQAVNGLLLLLPDLRRPTAEEITEACDYARQYKTSIRKDEASGRKENAPRYFAFLPEFDSISLIDGQLNTMTPQASASPTPCVKAFWDNLKRNKRTTNRAHVTLVHKQSLPEAQNLWNTCLSLASSTLKSPSPLFELKLGTLLCDDEVMSVTVESAKLLGGTGRREGGDVIPSEQSVKTGQALLDMLPEDLVAMLHITIGTKDDTVKPIEGGRLVQRWKNGESGISAISLGSLAVTGKIRGLWN